MTDYFRAGKYGKLFLEKLQEEIEGLEFTPDGSDLYPFRESDELIQRGYEAKEPALLYLNAEMQRHGAGMSDETILNLYMEAAQFGSVPAALWLVYCESQGFCAISEMDRVQIDRCLKESKPPETVVLNELKFLEDAFEHLCVSARIGRPKTALLD